MSIVISLRSRRGRRTRTSLLIWGNGSIHNHYYPTTYCTAGAMETTFPYRMHKQHCRLERHILTPWSPVLEVQTTLLTPFVGHAGMSWQCWGWEYIARAWLTFLLRTPLLSLTTEKKGKLLGSSCWDYLKFSDASWFIGCCTWGMFTCHSPPPWKCLAENFTFSK